MKLKEVGAKFSVSSWSIKAPMAQANTSIQLQDYLIFLKTNHLNLNLGQDSLEEKFLYLNETILVKQRIK